MNQACEIDCDYPKNIINLFDEKKLIKVCAPMVRYSKLQFRNLIKKYDCDLCFTPMILADSFCRSEKARINEFTTNLRDTPLITQFAANTAHDFVGAAHLVSPYCDGVDLNCGCPQTWAKQMGIGSALLNSPDLIYDIVHQCKNQISKPFSISVKMRILKDPQKTVEICRQLEKTGVSFLTVHARPSNQTSGEINLESLKLIRDAINIPLIANGGVKSLEGCEHLQKETKCQGVMVANAILSNPTLFTGTQITPEKCIQDWLDICFNSTLTEKQHSIMIENGELSSPLIYQRPYNLTFQMFHHHLVFMMEKLLTKKEHQNFNNYKTFDDVLNFVENKFQIKPHLFSSEEYKTYKLLDTNYDSRHSMYSRLKFMKEETVSSSYDYSETDGKFFKNKIADSSDDDSDCEWAQLFIDTG